MYCVNLVHSHINIFDSNHERIESLIQWHSKIKGKIHLIYDALCKATDWKKHKMPNLTHLKYPLQPCTLQAHANDDAFFAWKNIELWNGDTWQGNIEEVRYFYFTPSQFISVTTTSQNLTTIFNAAYRYFLQGRDATLFTFSSHEPDERVTTSIGQVLNWRTKGVATICLLVAFSQYYFCDTVTTLPFPVIIHSFWCCNT
jgi:hypothetical protein